MEHETDRLLWSRVIRPAWRSRAVFFIRLAVGLIFFTQGVLKYIDPNMGVNRFTKIGFSHPYFPAHFVGTFEMVCRPNQGFWFMISDARTDFSMLMSLLFLISAGAGSWSLDSRFEGSIPAHEQKR